MSPPTRRSARRWRVARAASSAGVDSQTVRKHSTCRHRPAATASIASTIEPAVPASPWPPLIHVGRTRRRVLDRGDAALRVARSRRHRRPGRSPGRRCRPRQPGVGDRLHAGLDGERQRIAHQPPPDLRHADARDRHLVLELLGRHHRPGVPDRLVLGGQRPRLGIAGGPEQREPHVVLLLEHDLHPHPDMHVARVAPHDVRRQPDPVVLVERHDRDDVRRDHLGEPLVGFTVHPTTVARPDTSTISMSVEWQYGQTGVGGRSNAPHGMLRWTRSTPSRPDVQKNSFWDVSSGSGRW